MARQARKISSTGYYHVIMRGNNKTKIFQDNKDKNYFMTCLQKVVEEELIEITAWCLMDNHVHLVVKADAHDLTTAFKRINIKYAMHYNWTYGTVGHVFQDRFASEAVESDAYLLMVVRYVHNNPVKAKMVEKPWDYRWSSYKMYQGSNLSEPMALVMTHFKDNWRSFEAFHKEEDHQEYLEIKEDRDAFRRENAQNIIQEYRRKYGLIEGKEVFKNRDIRGEMVVKLVKESGMSLRSISKLLELPFSTIQNDMKRVSKELMVVKGKGPQ